MTDYPKVSVVTITYGHEKYITQTLNGILMQDYPGEIEFIIANDNSPDSTDERVKNYFNEKPTPANFDLKYTKHDTNKGMMPNFIWALEQATGEYIALCEGDDYWTDPLKLQKQVDFLEANEDYVICFHKVQIFNKGELVKDFITEERYDRISDFPISQISLFKHSNFIHTPSVMFRKQTEEIPWEFNYSPVGDYFLYYWLSQYGYIHRINEVMAVYRYEDGIYSKLSELQKHKVGEIFGLCILSFISNKEIKEKLLLSNINKLQNYHQQNINNFTIRQLVNFTVRKLLHKINHFI